MTGTRERLFGLLTLVVGIMERIVLVAIRSFRESGMINCEEPSQFKIERQNMITKFKVSTADYKPYEARLVVDDLLDEILELESSLQKWAAQGYGPIVNKMTVAEIREVLNR